MSFLSRKAEPTNPTPAELAATLTSAKVDQDSAIAEAKAIFNTEKAYVLEAAERRIAAITDLQTELTAERVELDSVAAKASTPVIGG